MKLYSPVTLVIKIAMYLHPRAQKLCLQIFNNITLVYKKDEFMLDRVTFDTVGWEWKYVAQMQVCVHEEAWLDLGLLDR